MVLITNLQTRAKESETLETLYQVVDLHFSLLRHPARLEVSEETKLLRAWLALTTSSSHSSRVALSALESGYYSQAFALTRAVFEDWLTAYDCEEHSETVAALLDSNEPMPRFSNMYERLPCEVKRLWGKQGNYEGTYGFLSTFAHPRFRAMEDILNPEGQLRVVPEYHEMRFALAAWFWTKANLAMLEFVAKLAEYLDSPEAHEWRALELETVRPRGYALLELLDKRLVSYLDQPV